MDLLKMVIMIAIIATAAAIIPYTILGLLDKAKDKIKKKKNKNNPE